MSIDGREEARAQHRKAELEYEKRRKAEKERCEKEAEDSEIWKMGLRPATPKEYTEWLDRHLEAGGKITNIYGYNFPSGYYVAKAAIFVTPLYGSSSVSIIVPAGINVTFSDLGHNNIFYMFNGSCTGGAPLYVNT
jgi:hypothetical protein